MSEQTDRGAARRARTDDRLSQTVREHLRTHGYAGLTIERVAADSGVAKTTIYRRWASKAEMVFDLAIHRADDAAAPDTGSLASDVAELAKRAVRLVAGQPGRSVLPGLLADMAKDSGLTSRFRESFIGAARADIAAVIDRAVLRGELATGVDVDAFQAALLGIPYAQVHLLGKMGSSELQRTVTNDLLAILRAHKRN